MSDSYSNVYCDWCGKNMIVKEANTGNITQGNVTLCSFCIKFPRIDVMTSWKTLILNYALTDKGVRITSIDYDEETDNYTINFEWYDNEQVRQGWVA